jgi:hypothetical protein
VVDGSVGVGGESVPTVWDYIAQGDLACALEPLEDFLVADDEATLCMRCWARDGLPFAEPDAGCLGGL